MTSRTVAFDADGAKLQGDLTVEPNAKGMILFAHGSGSSRLSRRNRYVASRLVQNGLATFLLDLLTKDEEQIDDRTARLHLDIPFLAHRLLMAAEWLKNSTKASHLQIGLFGASTGGGAALVAAAEKPEMFYAVVSRGGRPDLAGSSLPLVKAPTLLIVGGNDHAVLSLNEYALPLLMCEAKMEIVPEAGHLFEEPGKLEIVASLASSWFLDHL